MTDSFENHDTTTTPVIVRDDSRPTRLYRALAWVGIVAGSLFIVGSVFFSGYALGSHGGGGWHGGHSHGGGWNGGPHRMKGFDKNIGPGVVLTPDGERGPGPAASSNPASTNPSRP